MNSLRILLVGAAAIAAATAAVYGMWAVTGVLTVGIVAHGALWLYLHRQRENELAELHRGVDELLRRDA